MLANISLSYVALLAVVSVMSLLINGCQFKYLMRIFDIRLKFNEWFGLTAINTLYNYYMPARGGSISRAVYLKFHHGFLLSYYLSLNAGAYFVNFLIASFFATVFVLIYYLFYDRLFTGVLFISASLLVATMLLAIIIFKSLDQTEALQVKGKIWRIFFKVGEGLRFFQTKPDMLLLVFVAKMLFILTTSARLYLAFFALGMNPNLLCILIIGSLVVFSMLISITPGNLGVKEGVISLLASMLGVSFDEAILAAVLDRAVTMIVVISLGLIFSYVLLYKKKVGNDESKRPRLSEKTPTAGNPFN